MIVEQRLVDSESNKIHERYMYILLQHVGVIYFMKTAKYNFNKHASDQ